MIELSCLEVLKNEFPKRSVEISESLELIKMVIEDTHDDLGDRINKEFSDKKYENISEYTNIAALLCEYITHLDDLIDHLDIDYTSSDNIELDDEENTNHIINYEDYVVEREVEHTLFESYTHKRPFGFKYGNEKFIKANSWKDMFARTSEFLYEIDKEKFLSFENNKKMNGKHRKYFSVLSEGMYKPVKIANSMYIETNANADSIRNIIIGMLKQYGLDINKYKIFLRADYSNIKR